MHVHTLAVNGTITGRAFVDHDGGVHYDLMALGAEEVTPESVRTLALQVELEVRFVLGALLVSGIGSLFALSPALAKQMVNAVAPDLLTRGRASADAGERIAV